MVLRSLRLRLVRKFRIVGFRCRLLLVCILTLSCIALMTPSLRWPKYRSLVEVQHQGHQQKQQQDARHDLLNLRRRIVPLSPLLTNLSEYRFRGLSSSDAQVPALSTDCAGLQSVSSQRRPPEDMPETFTWQKMRPASADIYVFSAHLDLRWKPRPAVVVVGLTTEGFGTSCVTKFCHLWYRGDVADKPHVSPVNCRSSTETHERRYAPAFYTCFVRDNQSVPYAVSLVNDPCDTSSHNLLKVMSPSHNDGGTSSPVNFTVCVTPFNFGYDNVRQLVEMIEVNGMYGAQHFIFYNYSSGPNVTRYLNDLYVKKLGVATVIQWPLPMPVDVWPHDPKVTPEVHYFAQVAALNDCLYRCINRRSTFAIFTDLDEILVPRRRDSWTAMLEEVTAAWSRQNNAGNFPGSYLVRNVFFRTDWTQDQTFAGRGADYRSLMTLSTTEREQMVFNYMMRSKYIAWSQATITVGVHSVVDSLPEAGVVLVDETDALLHHYRLWIDDPNNPPPRFVDRHMHRYADTIVERTAAMHRFMTSSLNVDR